jgi:hypothetical protein
MPQEENFTTNAQYIAQGAGGLGDLGLGIYNIIQGSKNLKESKADYQRFMSERPELSASSAYAQAENQAYSKKMLDMQRQSLQRNLAQGVAAASADPRALAASLTGMQRSAAISEQQAVGAQAQQQMQATLARARAEDQMTGAKESRSQGDIAMARENINASRQAIGQGIGQAVGGAGSVAGAVVGLNGNDFFGEKGGVIKTPGSFSHEKNPIHMVKDGAKIGEMTGGEYIFNPNQMSKIKGHVSSGNKEQLHKYMKTLIKKFEK